jgi:OPA family sugar phosphate sensor protein UhpC-like MFS transporter
MVRQTLASRSLRILALGFFVVNAIRYSFINWTVQYMADFHGRSIRDSVFTAIVLPLAGSLGVVTAGWASDALFGRRRAPVCVLMLLGVTVACATMSFVPRGDWLLATALLAVTGFLIHGPDVLIAGAATADFSHPRAVSMAMGVTMCMGALGAIFSGAGIGYLTDLSHGNWSLTFQVLAVLPVVPTFLMIFIWNAQPRAAIKTQPSRR